MRKPMPTMLLRMTMEDSPRVEKKGNKGKKIDDAELAGDKDKARYVKGLRSHFEFENGYYLVMAMEQGVREEKNAAGGAPQAGGGQATGYKPYEKSDLHVLAGRDEAVSFILEYMSEFGNPWEKKGKREKGVRGKKEKSDVADATAEPPKPMRDWKLMAVYETEREAENAKNYQEYQQQQAIARSNAAAAAAAAAASKIRTGNFNKDQ